MPKMKLTIVMAVLALFLVILIRLTYAASPAMPWCSDVKNDHYSGPCVAVMIDGVITGDETR